MKENGGRERYHHNIFMGARLETVTSSDEFENGYIPMHCGAPVNV